MPYLKCYCGKDINFKPNQIRTMILELPQFCSIDCLSLYLRNNNFSDLKQTIKIKPCVVVSEGSAKNVWDSITKHYYRSLYEIFLVRYFLENDIDFLYESITLDLDNNKVYTPDFYLKKINLFIEVKGFFSISAKNKIKLAISKNIPIILVGYYLYQEFKRKYLLKDDIIK